jgi:hypothetical protein
MAEKALSVKIVLKEGPAIIRSLNGAGISAKYDLWNDIVASEFFPPNKDSAFYVLSLEKSVTLAAEVCMVEAKLLKALELLAAAWPFSGGSFMIPATHEVTRTPRYTSNAKEVEAELLARAGLQHVESRATINVESLAIYRKPPLATATHLAKAMLDDPPLCKLLGYYRRAWVEYYSRQRTERSSWFIDLYKTQDTLKKVYGKDKVKSYLGILKDDDDWPFFETILNNNDLRHAEISGTAPIVAAQDVDRLYRLARSWIEAHLVNQGLPVVPV